MTSLVKRQVSHPNLALIASIAVKSGLRHQMVKATPVSKEGVGRRQLQAQRE